jgi:hypothetical protein
MASEELVEIDAYSNKATETVAIGQSKLEGIHKRKSGKTKAKGKKKLKISFIKK